MSQAFSSAKLLTVARRIGAVVCLVSAYEFAVTEFATRWLVVSIVAATIVASGPLQWVDEWALPDPLPWPRPLLLWRNLAPGWALMLLAAGLKLGGISSDLVVSTWLAGAGWLLVGAWLMSRPSRPPAAMRGTQRSAWVCGVLIVAVAAGLRFWAINKVPRYVHADEGTTVIMGLDFLAAPNHDWYRFLAGTTQAPCFVLTALGAYLFGFNLTAARLPDVLLGILSIAFTFDGLRRVTNLRVAAVGAILLATNHCHLAFSRIASSYIQTAFVVSYVIAVFARVWTAPTYFAAVLLGVGAIAGAQTYVASIMMPPFLVFSMGLLWLLNPPRRRALLVPLSLFLISSVAAGAPLGVAVWQHGDEMTDRSRAINIFVPAVMESLKHETYHTDSTAEVVARQAWKALRAFYVGEDTNPQYGIWLPIVDRYTAALIVPGTVFALLAARQFLAVNALVFTIGYLLLALGMQKTFGYERTTGLLPLAMAVPAVALVQCWGALFESRHRWTQWGRDACLFGSIALCAAANFHIYFGVYSRWLYFGDEASEMGWVAREHADRYVVHLLDQHPPGHEAVRLILGSVTAQDNPRVLLTPRDVDPAVHARTVEVHGNDLFVVWSQDFAARDALLARFPEAIVQPWGRPGESPPLYLIFVGPPKPVA